MCWSSFWQTMPTMTPFVCQSNHMGSSTTIYKSIPWDGSFCICSSQQRNKILARVLSYVIRLIWKLWEMTRRLFFLFSFNALTWNSRIPTEKFDKGTVILKTSQPENITFKSQSHAIGRLILSRTLWDSTHVITNPHRLLISNDKSNAMSSEHKQLVRMQKTMLSQDCSPNVPGTSGERQVERADWQVRTGVQKQCYRKTVPSILKRFENGWKWRVQCPFPQVQKH